MNMTAERAGEVIDRATAEIAKDMVVIAELREALSSVLSLARIKWGNLDAEVNTVFDRAEALLGDST